MKVLILSCNTGGGHNAAGIAVKERLLAEGHEAEVFDYLTLSGKRTSRLVGDLYVDIVKGAPRLFGAAYHLGMAVSRISKKSPVYYANAVMGKYLRKYLKANPVDAIVMPHLYPAETLCYLKRKGVKLPLTVAVMTDYTCIPFWEETDCDYYIVPHSDLVPECEKRGIPGEKLIPLGIPVSPRFLEEIPGEQAKAHLGFSRDKKLHLLLGGSMGAGKLVALAKGVYRKNGKKDEIAVICGSNFKVRGKLEKEFSGCQNVRIYGHTDVMYLFMKAADIIYTKPGGLTSTEAAVVRKPLVHTFPIPGCETANRRFFVSRGMSVSARTVKGLVSAGYKLLHSKEKKKRMKGEQAKQIRRSSAEALVNFLEEKVEERKGEKVE